MAKDTKINIKGNTYFPIRMNDDDHDNNGYDMFLYSFFFFSFFQRSIVMQYVRTQLCVCVSHERISKCVCLSDLKSSFINKSWTHEHMNISHSTRRNPWLYCVRVYVVYNIRYNVTLTTTTTMWMPLHSRFSSTCKPLFYPSLSLIRSSLFVHSLILYILFMYLLMYLLAHIHNNTRSYILVSSTFPLILSSRFISMKFISIFRCSEFGWFSVGRHTTTNYPNDFFLPNFSEISIFTIEPKRQGFKVILMWATIISFCSIDPHTRCVVACIAYWLVRNIINNSNHRNHRLRPHDKNI